MHGLTVLLTVFFLKKVFLLSSNLFSSYSGVRGLFPAPGLGHFQERVLKAVLKRHLLARRSYLGKASGTSPRSPKFLFRRSLASPNRGEREISGR
jgi:hypothetical protein